MKRLFIWLDLFRSELHRIVGAKYVLSLIFVAELVYRFFRVYLTLKDAERVGLYRSYRRERMKVGRVYVILIIMAREKIRRFRGSSIHERVIAPLAHVHKCSLLLIIAICKIHKVICIPFN